MRVTRLVLALIFAGGLLMYAILFMVATRPGARPAVELGYDDAYLKGPPKARLVTSVKKDSPAERADLRPGDRIIAVEGQPLEDDTYTDRVWRVHKPGDVIHLTVERADQRTGVQSTVELTGVFRKRIGAGDFGSKVQFLFPVPFVLVGLGVLLLHIENRNVWLLALLFAGLTATAGIPGSFGSGIPALHKFGRVYQSLCVSVVGPVFYFLFAVFPVRSSLDRRLPWLKWAAAAFGLSLAVPGFGTLMFPVPPPLARYVSARQSQNAAFWYEMAFLALGFLVLITTFQRTDDIQVRRKIRVIFWGTLVSVPPALARAVIENTTVWKSPGWSEGLTTLLLFGFPLSFAYAVVKHRVLDIPLLLKRSARYLLVQRGFVMLSFSVSVCATWLFVALFLALAQPRLGSRAVPAGLGMGVAFGCVLAWGGLWVHRRVGGRIDRAFFRSAYDARLLLENLAEKIRTVTSRHELAVLLRMQVNDALRPETVAVYLESGRSRFEAEAAQFLPRKSGMEDAPVFASTLLSAPDDLVCELLRSGSVWDFASAGETPSQLLSELAPLKPECIVPMQARDGRLVGLLLLGPRLSEEPYSREDLRLLSSVASHAAVALDNIRLAGDIAERIEAERLAAKELEIAKEVQARLFPQTSPPLQTLDYAGTCIQARGVGGDYYDFLDFGEGRVGLVLADIVGKGIGSSLLMANLQANLRSQAVAREGIASMLRSVNHLFRESTLPHQFATLFFGCYDDATRTLQYANCGHTPPFLLRACGGVERLPATSTVLGLFEDWDCCASEVRLDPGDIILIYSDGLNEAHNDSDEEFGEERLLAESLACRSLPVCELMGRLIGVIQQFSAGRQDDDMTLLAARCR